MQVPALRRGTTIPAFPRGLVQKPARSGSRAGKRSRKTKWSEARSLQRVTESRDRDPGAGQIPTKGVGSRFGTCIKGCFGLRWACSTRLGREVIVSEEINTLYLGGWCMGRWMGDLSWFLSQTVRLATGSRKCMHRLGKAGPILAGCVRGVRWRPLHLSLTDGQSAANALPEARGGFCFKN